MKFVKVVAINLVIVLVFTLIPYSTFSVLADANSTYIEITDHDDQTKVSKDERESDETNEEKDKKTSDIKVINSSPVQMPNARLSSSTAADWKTMKKSGKFYFQIKGDGKTSKVWVNVKHSQDIGWDYFTQNSSTWTCSLSGTNNHNVKLKVSSVKTKQSSDSCYTVFVFTLSYTQSSHYKKDSIAYDKPDGLRLNYRKYTKNGGDGEITSDAPIVHSNTTRNITIQVNSRCMGINNTDKAGGDKKLYTNCGTTINFERPNRSVTFANGYGGTTATKTVADGNYVTAPASPTRNGYNFTGWSGNIGAIVCADRTHTAQWVAWKHTVQFNANGSTGGPTNQTKTYGVQMNLSGTKPNDRYGYNFKNWNTAANGSGTSYDPGQNYTHDQNGGTVTLYAQWTPWQHIVQYNTNGGSAAPSSQTKIYGVQMNLSGMKPGKSGFAFVCWNTKQDGSGTSYLPGEIYPTDQNGGTIVLYAQWKALYEVSYVAGESRATGTVPEQVQPVDQSVKLQKNGFSYSDGKFMNWNLLKKDESTGDKKYVPGTEMSYVDFQKAAETTNTFEMLALMNRNVLKMSAKSVSALEVVPENSFTMQAKWNKRPILSLNNSLIVLENEKIGKKQLFNLVKSCVDKDIDDKDIGLKDVKIIQIEYQSSKNGFKPDTQYYSKTDGMQEEDGYINTYFKQLKREEIVDIRVSFYVKDTVGNETIEVGTVKVKYNNPPVLRSYNLSFYENQLVDDPEKVITEIKGNCNAEDKEDDEKKLPIKVDISKPEKFDINDIKELGIHKIEYSATDSLGKTSKLETEIFIASNNPYKDSPSKYVRFISKDYLYTLEEDGAWKKNNQLYRRLRDVLNKSEDESVMSFNYEIE